ncbi:MAG: hypothetical protein AMXMBFR84_04100 [Candidatus Hydrogenedentota bacterium]
MGISVVIPVYNSEGSLKPLVERLHPVPEGCHQEYELILVNGPSAKALIEYSKVEVVQPAFHHNHLRLSPYGRLLGGNRGQYLFRDHVLDRLVPISIQNNLKRPEQGRMIGAIRLCAAFQ